MEDHTPPYRWAAAAALSVFVLYVVTLAPTTAFWDASEYIATGWILGIPHPPGNPLFVVLARVWALLLEPLGLPVPIRVNLFAAATSAVASGFFFLVAHRMLIGLHRDRVVALVGAGASVILGATTFTVWNQSNVNEKVYTLSLAVIGAVTWLAIRWRDRREEPGSVRYLLAAGYLIVLGSTNHLMSVLPAPALVVFVLMVQPGLLARKAVWIRGVPLILLGLSFNFFLPIRAEQRPVINEGDPLCETATGAAVAVFTNGRGGCPALASVLSREQYAKPPVSFRQAPLGSQLHNYFQYFDWQWARGVDPSPVPGNARLPFTLVFVGLGFLGLWALRRADRGTFVYVGVLTLTVTLGLVFYLNFKYGYSLAPEITDQSLHEVRERDYFFVASFLVWGFLAGLGLTHVWATLGRSAASSRPRWSAAPVMLVAFIPLIANWSWASRSGDYAARDWAYDLLQSVEPYGVLFTNGDNDTFPLWYLQEVEGIRKDVTVIVLQYLYTSWYPKQLQELTVAERQRPFQPDERVASLYESRAGPARPVISASHEEMDRVQTARVGQDLNVPMGPVVIQYPSGTVLDRGEQLALAIIRDSIVERPIYFASSAGLIGSLGLDQWGVKQGLATRLSLDDPESTPGLVQVSPRLGGDWVDVDRSRRLAEEVFLYRAIREREIWADRATLNIPLYYYLFSLQMTEATAKAGLSEEVVSRYREDAEAFLTTAQGGEKGMSP